MLVGEVLNMVAELKEQGTTILMTTHEMSFAHEVMDESQDPETKEFFSHFRN